MQDDLYQLDAPQSSEKSEQAILENLNDSQKQAVSAEYVSNCRCRNR